VIDIAVMIRMIETTTTNSIIENPRWRFPLPRSAIGFAAVFFTLTPRTIENCAI
jgi:hypothetical protein